MADRMSVDPDEQDCQEVNVGPDVVRVPAPAWLVEDSRRFVELGNVPAVPRPSATVVLMRPGKGEFEIYTQRRPSTMAFAPSMYVFPGGSVDVRDAEARADWVGPAPEHWAAVLNLPEAQARAVVCAAVREVFEECGVLLAGPDEHTVVGDVCGPEWESARVALLAREIALVELLAERGLAVRSDLLTPWSRWVTPEFEPRRFDTYFFLARMPADQRTRDLGQESEHDVWLSPAQAAALPMLPPTAETLRQLEQFASIDELVAASTGRDLTVAVMPRIHIDDEGAWLLLS